jgi:hypothetical protein
MKLQAAAAAYAALSSETEREDGRGRHDQCFISMPRFRQQLFNLPASLDCAKVLDEGYDALTQRARSCSPPMQQSPCRLRPARTEGMHAHRHSAVPAAEECDQGALTSVS